MSDRNLGEYDGGELSCDAARYKRKVRAVRIRSATVP